MKNDLAPDKSFRKTFGRKKIIRVFKKSQIPTSLALRCKSDQINMSDEVKARELALEGKSR